MNRKHGSSVFGLIEFAIVAGSIALVTSAAVPQQPASRLSANEAAAIASLRAIVLAQAQFKAAVDVDSNCDGMGEYGYLAELAGTKSMRICCQGGVPGAGNTTSDLLQPPLLSPPFGVLSSSSAQCAGYQFQLWLPTFTNPWLPDELRGVREDATGGKLAAPFPGPSNCSLFWCCYAWPIQTGVTGNRAFFVNQRGVVLQSANDSATPYTGTDKMPDFGEAYAHVRSMASSLRIGSPGGADGTTWTKVWP